MAGMWSFYFIVGIALAAWWVESLVFLAMLVPTPGVDDLAEVRDTLWIALHEGRISAREPAFEALYRNVDLLLSISVLTNDPLRRRVRNGKDEKMSWRWVSVEELAALPAEPWPLTLRASVRQLQTVMERWLQEPIWINAGLNFYRHRLVRSQRNLAAAMLKMLAAAPDENPAEGRVQPSVG